jgi:hypothetical protein
MEAVGVEPDSTAPFYLEQHQYNQPSRLVYRVLRFLYGSQWLWVQARSYGTSMARLYPSRWQGWVQPYQRVAPQEKPLLLSSHGYPTG